MAKSPSYWDKRAIQRLTDAEKQSDECVKRIAKMYDQAERNIQRDIENIYANYSKATGLDVQSLKTLLTKSETDKLWKELKAKGLDKYVKGNYKARITRLERLQAQVYAKAKELYPKEQQAHTEHYKSVINDTYYKSIYDAQMGTGYDFAFSEIDDNMVNSLLSERWSGKNYSQRIWGNTDILAESLSEIVGGAMVSGQSIAKTSRQIRERFNVSKYYADRLVRTETNHFNNEADAMAYEEMDVDKYVFMATLDTRTSTKCQEMDGEVIPLAERKVGVNFPPLHPNCRSKTRAYMGEEIEKTLKRRARNPITGKNEIVDNISYKEWAEKNGLDKPKAQWPKPVKKEYVKPNDWSQYNRYTERLKDSPYLPKTLEKFVKIKYNNDGAYDRLAREYKTIGRINKYAESPEIAKRDISTYYRFRQDDIEMTDHSIFDYHLREFKGDGTRNYDYNKIVEIIKKPPNYFDKNTNRNVNYYDRIAVLSETDTKEIVSIIKGRLNKKWSAL